MREIKTKEEIQRIIQEQIDSIPEIIEDRFEIKVSPPYQHEIDSYGCNWNISIISNAGSHIGTVHRIISNNRRYFNLAE